MCIIDWGHLKINDRFAGSSKLLFRFADIAPAPRGRGTQPMYKIPQLTPDFGNPRQEAEACRTDCALFDFSFVRRASVRGTQAAAITEQFAGRSLRKLEEGKILYAIRLNGNGTVCSDVTVWKMSDQHFQIMSGHHQDITDLQTLAGAMVTDHTNDTAIFAVQGPNAYNAISPFCSAPEGLKQLRYFEWATLTFGDIKCLVGRLGYTGEAGFELICPRSLAPQLWSLLAKNIPPAGFIAADMLRIEAGFPLFWNDFAIPVEIEETGLGAFSNATMRSDHKRLRRVCFSANAVFTPSKWRPAQVPARPKHLDEIAVTSACFSPRAGQVLGLGYVRGSPNASRSELHDPAGNFTRIKLEPLPYYDPMKLRPRKDWC